LKVSYNKYTSLQLFFIFQQMIGYIYKYIYIYIYRSMLLWIIVIDHRWSFDSTFNNIPVFLVGQYYFSKKSNMVYMVFVLLKLTVLVSRNPQSLNGIVLNPNWIKKKICQWQIYSIFFPFFSLHEAFEFINCLHLMWTN
jgi:hypothetical protein